MKRGPLINEAWLRQTVGAVVPTCMTLVALVVSLRVYRRLRVTHNWGVDDCESPFLRRAPTLTSLFALRFPNAFPFEPWACSPLALRCAVVLTSRLANCNMRGLTQIYALLPR